MPVEVPLDETHPAAAPENARPAADLEQESLPFIPYEAELAELESLPFIPYLPQAESVMTGAPVARG